MSTTNFNLRGISQEIMGALKQKAKKQHVSVNLLILKLIEQDLGFARTIKKTAYHDLDKLAGTWSAKDAKEFSKSIKDFEQIDEDLWS